jgi:hypothetical protein
MKFKSNIEIQAGVEAGGSTGSNGQVLSSTGTGVAWINHICKEHFRCSDTKRYTSLCNRGDRELRKDRGCTRGCF